MPKKNSSADPVSFRNAVLDENSVAADPVQQFSAWFTDAVNSGVTEPEAMFLATAGKNGIPSGRIVLLKGFDPKGFVFFTNYNSRKGLEIKGSPSVAVVFHWKEIERQVRITGMAERIPGHESDTYFSSRPIDSRISAMISPQSSVIPNRIHLEAEFTSMKLRMEGKEPERPSHWGGFRIIPVSIEFWQSQPHRLHDRIQYRLENGKWIIERLAP
ncbi:MAG: pyridoxamine 5'-phosphate oxidase [Bacteroidetes bacterium]|nr:pyridoxamine 5'-phosphate oxidase [Bacteroidota bacterium]